jgi:hypothetical protein
MTATASDFCFAPMRFRLRPSGPVHLFGCPQCKIADFYYVVEAEWRSWP